MSAYWLGVMSLPAAVLAIAVESVPEADRACPDKACGACDQSECRYPGWRMCRYPKPAANPDGAGAGEGL